jgi:asparagine synthase (glutamine-hydrolysing)
VLNGAARLSEGDVPGILGAASLDGSPIGDLPFHRVLARLRHQPKVETSLVWTDDRRAALGAVDLGFFAGSGSSCSTPDGSVAVIHGEVTRPAATPRLAATLLERYRRDPQSLARVEGSFALAMWDAPRATLVLAHDRFGLRNVYYTRAGGVVCFAPLVGALLAFGVCRPEIDLAGVADFLAFEHLLGDETLVRGIHALPPATIARFDARGVRLERYWTPRYQGNGHGPADAYVEEFGRRLGAAASRSVSASPRAGIPVSGGLDSRTILAVARDALHPSTHCFTYGVPGCDDLRLATALVRRVGATHHTFELRPGFIRERAQELVQLTDGMHLGLNVHATVLQQCVQWCDVIVLGNGGDCLLDRLWWWRDDAADEDSYVARMYERMNHVLSPGDARRLLTSALGHEFATGTRERLRRRLACYPGATAADAADGFNVGERHWRWVLQGIPAQTTHVEFREPFYDYAVADFALTVPGWLRAGRRLHIELLRRHAPDLARVPRQGGGYLVGSPVLARVRGRLARAYRVASRIWGSVNGVPAAQCLCGFADYDFELRGASRSLLAASVLSERTFDRGWYRPEALRALVDEHLLYRRNHARLLGAIATLELWMRSVFDGR